MGQVEIAKRTGVSESSIDHWKRIPEFRARLDELHAAYRAQLLASLPERLQTKQARLLELGQRYAQIEREFEARAENFRSRGLKHGSTGLVVETFFATALLTVPNRSSWGNGRGVSNATRITLNIAVFAPMPKASYS